MRLLQECGRVNRLIVAHAIAGAGKLITKGQRIHKNFAGAIW
jgi:hypothetical protein